MNTQSGMPPKCWKSLDERGVARQKKGDFDGALADYNHAIKLNPRFADAWFNRATYWKAKGDFKQAEADFTRVIELNPNMANAYAQRGLARLLNGRDVEAEQDFARCLTLNDNLKQTLARLIAEAKQQLTQSGSIR